MNRCSFCEWISILPWPVWPLRTPRARSPAVGYRDCVGPACLARAGGGPRADSAHLGGDLVRCTDVHRMVHSTWQRLAMSACGMLHGVTVYGALRPSAQAI